MIITLDFETYYDKPFSLTKLTTEEYIRDDRFEVIGVGKLGQDCAEVMAEHYQVVGYDVEPRSPAFPMMSSKKNG